MKFKGKKAIMAAALSAIVAASSLGTTITANAANNTYDIEVSVGYPNGSSGTINVSKLKNISVGESVTVTVTPDPGCYINLFAIPYRTTARMDELYCFWGRADDGISTDKMEYTFAMTADENEIIRNVEIAVCFEKIIPDLAPTPDPTPTPTPTPSPTWEKGDANCDGRVNAEDATAILKHTVGIMQLSEQGCKNADMDDNGKVTAADATAILKSLVSRS